MRLLVSIFFMTILFSRYAFGEWQPLDTRVEIVQSSGVFDRVNKQIVSSVSIKNLTDTSLNGPFRLVISDASMPLLNFEGETAQGSPYIALDTQQLVAGQTLNHQLAFLLARKRLSYQAALYQYIDNDSWELVWQDEFNGENIDLTKWSFEENCWGGGNNEQQCYTARDKNAYLENGLLNIVAHRETYTGPAAPDGSGTAVATLPYTSARLRSMHKGDWQYGRFEIRAKMPYGQGTWPAIWMLPTDYVYGGWAASGEIDIVEAVNLKTASDAPDTDNITPENRVYGTLHYGRAWPENVHSGLHYRLPNNENPADGFHVYALEWEKDEIRWYVNGVHYATQRSEQWYSQFQDANGVWQTGSEDAPYNQRFHMLLNLAVGGAWAGNVNETGIDESVFPQALQIDYVRVYRCSINSENGQGCATVDDGATLVQGYQPPPLPSDKPLAEQHQLMLFDNALNVDTSLSTYNPDGTISTSIATVPERGGVLHIDQTGSVGNVYVQLPNVLNLSHWRENGVLRFDIRMIDSQSGESSALVKIDSGWPNVSDHLLTLMLGEEWSSVSLPLSELEAAGNRLSNGHQASLDSVVNAFVIEPLSPMRIQIDNLRWEYAVTEKDHVNIYIDQDIAPFDVGSYVASGSVQIADVHSSDSQRGKVKELRFNTDESVVYFQTMLDDTLSTLKYDISHFDAVQFDLNVLEDPRADRGYVIKMDCGHPCGSGDISITSPPINTWTQYTIPLSDLLSNSGSTLDLTNVDTPLVIFPSWGNQQGVVMQIDNVKLVSDGDDTNNPVTVVPVESPTYIYQQGYAAYWQGWDCCNNASVSDVIDEQRGQSIEVDFYGPSPTVSGLQASVPHDLSGIMTGYLTFSVNILTQPHDQSAQWRLKLEGRDGSFAEVLLSDNLDGIQPIVGQWQTYRFSLSQLHNAGVNLSRLHLVLLFPDWGKAQGGKYRLNDVAFSY
ncbi:family 16 glycosylhydrolase [Aestuariibacter sp. AA17]|uniref:Family 16 glycosylhydrolase n=1 Tax=Fluctibacter corallii TaxID=2984329 RepID=A0ABT3A785_9ALTE|nr:glycoside hydrolase family 16 protein [Aestuariibacter sp. AA17]MCV2884549.1 family 16 glycosylhydrolase [Aestuariibacter sp. AA17]